MRISWYRKPVAEPVGEQLEASWDELLALLQESWFEGPKDQAPGWSPCALDACPPDCLNASRERGWKCGGGRPHRLNENAAGLCCLVLDVDHQDDVGLSKILDACAPFLYALHSTSSDGIRRQGDAGPHCARIILPLARIARPQSWASLRHGWLTSAGVERLVDDVKDPVRFYYVPTVSQANRDQGKDQGKDGGRIFEVHDGRLLDLELHSAPQASPVRSSPQVADRPPAPLVDVSAIQTALRSWGAGEPDKNRRAKALADGKPWDGKGRRDAGMMALVGMILGRWPDLEQEALEHLFRPSILAMAARDGDTDVERELGKLQEKAERARPGAQEFRADRLAEKERAARVADATAAAMRGAPLLNERSASQKMDSSPKEEESPEEEPAPAAQPISQQAAERPCILVTLEIESMVADAEKALAQDPRVFVSLGALSRISAEGGMPLPFARDDEATPAISALEAPTLLSWASTAATWLKADGKGGADRVKPPGDVMSALAVQRSWPSTRRLTGICEIPTFRKDGTLLQAPGWDSLTGLYHVSRAAFREALGSVPDEPSAAEVKESLELVLEAVADFPFADGAARSAWVAALLTPFVRKSLDGCSPIFLVDANLRGSGKTKLVDLVALAATGRTVPKVANTRDDEEMRKQLLAIALAGRSMLLIDNIDGEFGTPSLDSALTAGAVEGRVLGETRVVSAPMRLTWFATGNNVTLMGDLARRTLPIRLVTPLEHPERREDFRHRNLELWAKEIRARYVRACLVLLRAFYAAGAPEGSAKPWGSFEAWQRVCCACVRWLGLPAPEDALAGLELAAPSDAEQAMIVFQAFAEWSKGEWKPLGPFLAKMEAAGGEAKAALLDLCGSRAGGFSFRRASALFTRHREKPSGGLKARSRKDKDKMLWKVETNK